MIPDDLASRAGGEDRGRRVYTVAELNRAVGRLLEGRFPSILVEGELSNLAAPSSGHLYFSLKDGAAQVRCAFFRGRQRGLAFRPADGMHVLVRARVSLYEPRGDYQLIVEHMAEAGDGALRRAFEELKARLEAEGLFAPERRRALPRLPRQIGVITSPTGAAVRDVLTVLRRRFPAIPVVLYPVPVQGREAAREVARMVELAGERRDCDVLIVCRGGGSLEDLQAFNEEVVARAIAACQVPVVTGIGHETDVTIADLAADLRAPTPSGAAECVSPDREEWLRHLDQLSGRLEATFAGLLERRTERLGWLIRRLGQQHPAQRLRQQAQRLDELEQRLVHGVRARLGHARNRLDAGEARLHRHSPGPAIRAARRDLVAREHRLRIAMRGRLARLQAHLEHRAGALESLSPLATLARGYSVLRREDGRLITQSADVAPGERLEARLSRGRLICRVTEAGE